MKIGEILVKQGIVTEKDIQHALSEQKRRGGKLGTNLVAMRLVTDESLAQALGKQFDLPCAKHDDFEEISSDVIKLISAEFADLHSLIPFQKDQVLHVAVTRPSTLEVTERIEMMSGCKVQMLIAPEIWIVSALERYYNVSRDWRFMFDQSDFSPDRSELLPDCTSFQSTKHNATIAGDGEISKTDYLEPLVHAQTPQDVISIVLDFQWKLYPRQAVYALNNQQLQGWFVRGIPTHTLLFRETRLPLKKAKTFNTLVTNTSEYHGSAAKLKDERDLLASLQIPEGDNLCVYPITSLNQTVALYVGLCEKEKVPTEEELDQTRWALSKAGCTLGMLALRNEITDHNPRQIAHPKPQLRKAK